MPQFDKLTFFHQVFWLLFFFPFFYLLILQFFLPKLSSVLKVRQKILNLFVINILTLAAEQSKAQSSFTMLCSFLFANKNNQMFFHYVLFFTEGLKQHLSNIPNVTLKNGLKNIEKQLYNQTSIFLFVSNLEISEKYFLSI